MRVLAYVEELSAALEGERAAGAVVGLVPTMGALHEGHLSLVERASDECGAVCVTVFVNPLQFGVGEDLDAYPRPLEADMKVASEAGATLVFAPSRDEMFPSEPDVTVHAGRLGSRLEGAHRPGHLDGVATVVAKFFAMAGPCRAYFGEKDFQQLIVVRRLVRDLSYPVEVVGCPTVRAADGLALSSRNAYLSFEEREAAPVLFRALQAGAAMVLAGERQPEPVDDLMAAIIEAEPLARLDYAAAVGAATLERPSHLGGEVRLLGAASFGRARLIDNLGVSL